MEIYVLIYDIYSWFCVLLIIAGKKKSVCMREITKSNRDNPM